MNACRRSLTMTWYRHFRWVHFQGNISHIQPKDGWVETSWNSHFEKIRHDIRRSRQLGFFLCCFRPTRRNRFSRQKKSTADNAITSSRQSLSAWNSYAGRPTLGWQARIRDPQKRIRTLATKLSKVQCLILLQVSFFNRSQLKYTKFLFTMLSDWLKIYHILVKQSMTWRFQERDDKKVEILPLQLSTWFS